VSAGPTAGPTAGPLAFTGGTIRTMDPARPDAEVVVVDGDRIAAVGGRDLLRRHPGTRLVDLRGRTLVPGFIDAHNHLSQAALHPRFGDASGATGPEGIAAAVRAQAAAEPEAPWVRLAGWEDAESGYVPSAADLDRGCAERPVVVVHTSMHQCVVNSAGLAALGIGRDTPDPPGGEIHRGPDGRPTGLLVERAWSEAHARSLAAYADPDRWADHIAARARVLLSEGIVAVHDAACSPEAEAVYRSMARAGALPISVLAMPHPAALLTNDQGRRLDGPPTGDGDEWFRIGPAKFFADGGVAIALDTRMGGRPLRYGWVMADLEPAVLAAARAGFRVAIHAIGNAGVAAAVRAMQAVRQVLGDGDHRFRVEHAVVTGPAEWAALADLGAVAVVQPGFVEHVGTRSGGVSFDDHDWLAFAGLADAGVTLAASSDDPCAPFPPLWGAMKGATRTTSGGIRLDPHQAVSFDDWLAAYTRKAAYAGGQENERGRLAPGLRADLVVLEETPDGPRVAETWVAGRRLFPDSPNSRQ
jgi:predicted amidohydrolase YtcJ